MLKATLTGTVAFELARHFPARREVPYRRFVLPGIDPSGVV